MQIHDLLSTTFLGAISEIIQDLYFSVTISTGTVQNLKEALAWHLEVAFKGFQLCLQIGTSVWSDNVDDFYAPKQFCGLQNYFSHRISFSASNLAKFSTIT